MINKVIISASRRTDIPSCYSDWFFNRIKEQYVLVRNPMNIHQISKINLSPAIVDCIVFWTKNPGPMIAHLDQLKEYHYYFQFTLNSYGQDVEQNVPLKGKFLIDTFQRLSAKIGPEKIIWRYDPIFLNQKYTAKYHIENFEKLANKLKNHTEKCTISFMDFYPKIKKNIVSLETQEMAAEQQREMAKQFANIAFHFGLKMDTCSEIIDLSDIGIGHAKCIDDTLISRITGRSLHVGKDKNQRLECGCVSSIDIGFYNTCRNGCQYCYANHNAKTLQRNLTQYNINAPLLCSTLQTDDTISERAVKSFIDNQGKLFLK